MSSQPTPVTATRRAVLAGGSGFIGQALRADLVRRGYAVAQVGRRGPDARWGDSGRLRELVDGADLLVNLAGRSVGCRYHDRNREEIYHSRIDTTQELHHAVGASTHPPRLWLNASTGTIYRHAMDRPQTEADGELGQGFSVDVARNWEKAFFAPLVDEGGTNPLAPPSLPTPLTPRRPDALPCGWQSSSATDRH